MSQIVQDNRSQPKNIQPDLLPAYRWVVLSAGVLAQGAFVLVAQGLPSIAVPLRDHFHATNTELGFILAAPTIGMVFTLYLWGRLTDRIGERRVVAIGLTVGGLGVLMASKSASPITVAVLLIAAGAFGSSSNSASGKAVMLWFPRRQRGLAMGIRQTALPLAGSLASVILPAYVIARGVPSGMVLMACICAALGIISGLLLKRPADGTFSVNNSNVSKPVDKASISRSTVSLKAISAASGLLAVPQFTLSTFIALHLHDGHGLSVRSAALVLAGAQASGVVGRIVTGWWSDRHPDRSVLFRHVCMALSVALFSAAVFDRFSLLILLPVLIITGGLGYSWNTLAFTIAGEAAVANKQGASLGLQNTIAVGMGGLTPLFVAPLLHVMTWSELLTIEVSLPLIAVVIISRSKQKEHYS